MKEFDFVSIGDMVVDTFIELKNASIHCNINKEECTMSMKWGDKIPFANAVVVPAVGNSPNASVSASRLGLKSAIISAVGTDNWGESCIDKLTEENVDISFIKRNKKVPTNHHYVLSYDSERTILIKHNEFEYLDPIFAKPPKFLYLSSLAPQMFSYHEKILKNMAPETKLIFQPGTYQIAVGAEKLKQVYQKTYIFTCNVQEARIILKNNNTPEELLVGIHNLGPKIVCITDGPNGAYVYDGTSKWFLPAYPDIAPPVERTGAGDSFTSTFSAFIAHGLSPQEALLRAPINSMSVVQYIGAQAGLLTREKIENYLSQAPTNYKLKKL